MGVIDVRRRMDRYINDVISGKQPAGQVTRLAVERHIRDLDAGSNRGLHFDYKAAGLVCDFFPLLSHHKGAKAGQSFTLMDWQIFYLASMFGWKRENGTRRFRKSYLALARKNGKTTLCAGKALYAAALDGESGAQVYFVATKEDQAKIGFLDSKNIISRSPSLAGELQTLAKSIYVPFNGSFIKPLGSDSETQDGLDPSYGIIDEYHAHPNDKMLNVIETGMGARRQPMIDIITTAGFKKEYPCFGFQKMVKSILEGDIDNDSVFGLIYGLDEEEAEQDWENPDIWVKANPCLNESVYLDNLLDFCRTARDQGGEKEVEFKTKHLNIWTDAAKTWISAEHWDMCKSSTRLSELSNRVCYAGLDLASTEDFCSLSLIFPLENGKYFTESFAFIPEDTLSRRIDRGLSSLRSWITDGHVIATPGNVTDYDYIHKKVMECYQRFDLRSLAFDRFNSSQLISNLANEGIICTPFGQGTVSMSFPTKEFKRLILKGDLLHSGNPVMRWQRGNVVITQDAAENEKPDKRKSEEKIDNIVASIMALGECLNAQQHESVYEKQGLVTVNLRR